MRRKLTSAGVAITCAFALALGGPRDAHADEDLPTNSYVFSDVGFNWAADVNDAGVVVGDIDGDAYLVWDGGWTYVGYIGVVRAINNNNEVVGHVWSGAGYAAFLWDGTNGARDLGNFGWASSLALDINDSGQVVGTVHDDAGGSHAFLWQDGSGYDLGVPDGFEASWGIAINASGEMACNAMGADGVWSAFRWTPDSANGTTGSWVALHSTKGNVVRGINGSGDIVGHLLSASGSTPMLWDGTGAHALGSFGYATAINDAGVVVGMGNYAFVWDAVNGTRDLTSVSSPDSVYGGIGALRFSSASAINASGQILATIDDYSNFLLTPSPLPPRPTKLLVSTTASGRSLSWNASAGATSYKVKRGTSGYGPFTTLATVTGTSFTDTTAGSGSYYYAVTASNAYGESLESDPTFSQPELPPAPPKNLSAKKGTAGNKGVVLSWTQSTSAGVVKNKVYRSTSSGSGYVLLATISAGKTFTDKTAASRTTYYYVVTAVSGTGKESANSNQASIRLR